MTAPTDFASVLERLRDTSRPFPPTSLYHFSSLSGAGLDALEAVWTDLSTERRHNLLQSLNDLGEANFEVNFEAVFRLGLEDAASEVRAIAIRALWEAEDPTLIAPFIASLDHDPDPLVRATAASGLGRFVYLGELEEITPAQKRRVEDALLAAIGGADELEVRRRALEAVSYSSRDEVPPLIAAAYASDDPKLRVSAVFSMGRNADRPRWSAPVRAELNSSEPEMRFEAARAAGELELRDAGTPLAALLEDHDTQVREAAVWSLGQIGGEFARRTLTHLLDETADEEEQDFIQEALDNLAFTDEVNAFSLFELGGAGSDPLQALDDDLDEDDPLRGLMEDQNDDEDAPLDALAGELEDEYSFLDEDEDKDA